MIRKRLAKRPTDQCHSNLTISIEIVHCEKNCLQFSLMLFFVNFKQIIFSSFKSLICKSLDAKIHRWEIIYEAFWNGSKRSSSSLIFFPFLSLDAELFAGGVIKNSACDCPSQLLYFVFSLSLWSAWAFFSYSNRASYQVFILLLSLSISLHATGNDHDFTIYSLKI